MPMSRWFSFVLMGAGACAGSPDTSGGGNAAGASGSAGTAAGAGGNLAGASAVAGDYAGGASAGSGLGGTVTAVAGAAAGGAAGGAGANAGGAAGAAGVAGTADAAGSAGQTSNDCSSPKLLCDDFESGKLDRLKVVETGGKFTLDSTHVYSGAASALLTIPANQRGGFLRAQGAPLFPLEHDTVWGRLMVYFEDLPDGHFDTVRAGPAGGGTPWYNIGGQYKAMLMNYYSGPLDCYGTINGKPPLPLKKWVCWEFQYDGEKNSMTLWVDGALSHSITGQGNGCVGQSGTWTAPTFGSVELGQFNAQTAGNQTRIWLDDIALGTSARLGCPAPSPAAH
jgi:hypothetical protein